MTTLSIDRLGPLPLVRPGSADELGEIIRRAGAEGAIYPIGGQTQMSLGRSPNRTGTAIDLRGLDQVIDFPARDMTITVGAGVTIARLQEILRAEHLRLPIDIPRSADATLGGSLAVNVSGHRRLGFGTLRDYVIGISAYNDEGKEFKAGGRVVKNVAGYDICKLLIGSMGTLGVITQATLKLRPLAEEQAFVLLPCSRDRLGALLDQLWASRTRPVAVDVLNARAAEQVVMPKPTSEAVVVVGYEGNTDAVRWQMQHLVKELGTSFPMEARVGYTGQPLDQALADWPLDASAKMTLKASLPSSQVAEFFDRANLWGEPRLRAHAASGVVLGHFGDLTADDAARIVGQWRQSATAVVVVRAPADWKESLGVWGPAPADLPLMREIKRQFDPRDVFNPGRFLV